MEQRSVLLTNVSNRYSEKEKEERIKVVLFQFFDYAEINKFGIIILCLLAYSDIG